MGICTSGGDLSRLMAASSDKVCSVSLGKVNCRKREHLGLGLGRFQVMSDVISKNSFLMGSDRQNSLLILIMLRIIFEEQRKAFYFI